MHVHKKDRAVFLRLGLLLPGLGLSAGEVPAQESAEALARVALAPYACAQNYKGALSITTVTGNAHSELNSTTSILARCDKDGAITRLRAQTISWGHQGSRDVTGEANATLIYDGATLWHYRSAARRYCCTTGKMPGLTTLLGLPSAEAGWSFMEGNELLPGERRLEARLGDTVWRLVVDSSSGRLHRIERLRQRGRQRIVTTLVLRDIAFDAAASAPDSRFMFQPPQGVEKVTDLRLPGLTLLP
jgi:outer membrane lipoprotein-sorting protein